MIRFLLPALLLCVSASFGAGEVSAWRIDRAASSDAPLTVGTQLVLGSAEISGDRLILRVGVQGKLGRPGTTTNPPFSEKDATLKLIGNGSQLACISLDKSWKSGATMILASGQMLAATLVFHAPPGLADQPLFLRISGYHPIAFRCSDGTPMALPDLSKSPERWELGAAVDAGAAGLENIRMELGIMRLWEGRLTFGLSFRNAGRFPLQTTGGPSGGEAILVSAEREFFRNPAVTGAIKKHIAPAGDWRPDETVTGTVTFPLPHLHGAARLWFLYPGFPDLPLVFDESLNRWRVENENLARRGVPPAQQRVRAEEELFQSAGDFWESISRQLNQKEFAACAAQFDRPDECALLRDIHKVPLAEIDVRPASAQRLAMTGDQLAGVRMEVRFRYRGEPEERSFILMGGCRMKRTETSAGWRVESLALDLAPPWAQGYTAFGESKHFLVFYRPDGGQVEEAAATLRQLEASWENITRTGLKLDDRYAAFLCAAPEDHRMLTGDRGVNVARASVGGFARDEGDRFRIYNVAVYVNPEIFRGPSAMQKRRSLQVALDHELVHAALAPWTRTWMPGWLVEGAAMHFSNEKRADPAALKQALSAGLSLRSITESGTLRDPDGDLRRGELQYDLAKQTVDFISSNWSRDKLLELYHAYSLEYPGAWRGPFGVQYADEDGGQKRRARHDLTQKLLKQVLGISIEDLESAVRHRLLQ